MIQSDLMDMKQLFGCWKPSLALTVGLEVGKNAAKAAKLFVGDSPGRSIGGTEADILQHMAAHLHQIYIKSIRNMKKPIETHRNPNKPPSPVAIYKCLPVYPIGPKASRLKRSNILRRPASHVRHLRHLGRTPQRRWKQLGEELCLPASVLQGYQPPA
jgi:hypothetical protein